MSNKLPPDYFFRPRFGTPVTYTTPDGVTMTAYPPDDGSRLYRVVVYCRVSTYHEDQLASLNAQLEYYQDYVRNHRGWILTGAYKDVKSARSIHARDQFEKMIADCMEGRIDIIVTKTVSRFGRNTVDTLSVLRNLREKGVDVFFEQEGLHSAQGGDELLISVLRAIARQTQNPDAAIYSRLCYGHRQPQPGQLAIYKEEAAVVRFIFDQYLQGVSVLGIKRMLEAKGIKTPTGKDVWPRRTIETLLDSEKYMGDSVVYKTYCAEYPDRKRIRNRGERESFIVQSHHPAIISIEQFKAVQKEIDRRSNIVIGEDGIARRKNTHYSSRQKNASGSISSNGFEQIQK